VWKNESSPQETEIGRLPQNKEKGREGLTIQNTKWVLNRGQLCERVQVRVLCEVEVLIAT
jgi:hypothetical protein